jgi:hypothetical protein
MVVARRFRCDAALCGRRIFTERFDDGILAPWAGRTARLDLVIHHLGLALGGRPAASFARRLMLPVSNDTLLRGVRRRGCPPFAAPSVIGIDDWAWRRNQRYGTIICDLERRRPITLLPDREPATAQVWLAGQPQIAVVAHDRGGGYALAAAKALPHATQVADRWHLMENASHAFLDAVRKTMHQVRAVVGSARCGKIRLRKFVRSGASLVNLGTGGAERKEGRKTALLASGAGLRQAAITSTIS